MQKRDVGLIKPVDVRMMRGCEQEVRIHTTLLKYEYL